MKNAGQWVASKYVHRKGRLRPSHDPEALSPASRLMAELLVDAYVPAFETHARGRLLDLGCGRVPFYAAYRGHVEDNVCVDWPGSPHATLHVDQFCDLSQPLPFPDDAFDTLLSSDVIEHLPDAPLAFREMSRVLRPGGTLLLNSPFLYMLHEVPHDYCRHTRYSLERLCRSAGLRVERIDELGGIGDVLCDLLGKAASTLPLIGRYAAVAMQAPAIALGRTGMWRRMRQASSSRFPLAHFLVAVKPAVD